MSDHDHEQPPIAPRLLDAARSGCEESRNLISRRAFMGVSASLCSWAFMPRDANAAPGTEKRLVVVILRGGMDGLDVLVPKSIGLEGYRTLETGLQILTFSGKTAEFLLTPRMPKLRQRYQAGEALFLHGIAPPLRNRSHFDCLDNLENGNPAGRGMSKTGWLNRMFSVLPPGDAVRSAGAVQIGRPPLIMRGRYPVMSWSNHPQAGDNTFIAGLASLYAARDEELFNKFSVGISTHQKARNLSSQSAVYGSTSPTPLQTTFRGAASLLAEPDGPRIATLDVNGWDTHSNQADDLTSNLKDLDNALDDLRVGLGDHWSRTVVVCVTEFGRTVKRNGTEGTDHGQGTVAFVLGGAVNGGRVIKHDTFSLAKADLVDGRDLKATLDTRQLFKGVLEDYLGVPRSLLNSTVFPESQDVLPIPDLIKSNPVATAPALARSVAEPASSSLLPGIGVHRLKTGSFM